MDTYSEVLTERQTSERRREAEILDAVLDLMSEQGYQGLTMDLIARRVKASKSTLYGRWGDKKKLVLAAIRADISPVDTVDTGTLRQDLLEIAKAVSLPRARATGVLLAIGTAATGDDEFAKSLYDALAVPYLDAFWTAVDRAIAREELSPASRKLTYAADLLPAIPIGIRLFGSTRQIDFEEFIDTIVLPALDNPRMHPAHPHQDPTGLATA